MCLVLESGGGSPWARNMSAPPRMCVIIRPLDGGANARPDAAATVGPPGFRLHARVDLGELFRHHFGVRRARAPAREQLRMLVLLARRALDARFRPVPADRRRLARRTEESLGDEFLELAGRLEPRALGLPGFALLRRPDGGPPAELDPARAVAILSRQDGRLFLAARSPSIPNGDDDAQRMFGLYVPGGGACDEPA